MRTTHSASHYRTGPEESQTVRWNRYFLLLLTLLTGWRLIYLLITPLDLAPDEAYYWDWGRHFAWGYYSKPPLIAWINLLITRILGATPFTVRLPAVLFSVVGLWFLYALARRLFNPRVAFWAMFFAAASPAACALSFVMTIDAPLVCFWILALYSSWRALENNRFSWCWWLLSAIFIGLGALSKQMMLVFLILLLVFLGFSSQDRPWLKRPWPYLTLGLSLAFLIPPLWWNMQHQWITFRHTAHHFGGNRSIWGFVKTFAEFSGGQLLLISPLPCVLFYVTSAKLSGRMWKQQRQALFLLIFGIVPLFVVILLSFRQRIYANWAAVYYPAGLVLLAAWFMRELSCGPWLDKWRRLFAPSALSSVGLVVLTYLFTFFFSGSSPGGGPLDPLNRLKGWRQLGREVHTLMQETPRPDQVFLVGNRRQWVSEMAFYVPGQPRVYLWNDSPGVVRSQYDLWPGPNEKKGWDCLIVTPPDREPHPDLVASFRSSEHFRDLSIPLGPSGTREISVYMGKDLQQWPH